MTRPLALIGALSYQCLTYCTDVIMSLMASQITRLTIVYSPASLNFVRGNHRWQVISPAQKASNVANISMFSMTSSWYSVLKRSSSVFGWKWRPLWQSNQKYLTKMIMILLIYWFKVFPFSLIHYSECPLNTIASQSNGHTTVCVTECLSQQQIKHHSFALLIICEGRLPLNDLFLHRRSVVRKTSPWHDVAMCKIT